MQPNAQSNLFGLGSILGTAAEDWSAITVPTQGGRAAPTTGGALDRAQDTQNLGATLAIGGAVSDVIGAYFGALSARHSLKSQELSLRFQQSLGDMNARAAEEQALLIIESGNDQISRLGWAAADEQARERVSAAKRGVSLNSGSAAEVRATMELVRQIDARTIRRNTVAQANATRMQGRGLRTQAVMAGVNAANARDSRGNINPALTSLSSLGESGSRFAGYFGNRYIGDRR